MGKQKQLCALIITLLCITESNSQKYTVCTTPQNLNACEQLNRSEDIKCVLRKNAVNCLLMVESGEASITSVTAEEIFLASSLTNNLIVLGEFIALANDRFSINQGEAADFETVVLMKDSSSIKGTRFCHPGIDINPMSPFILKEFEMQVLSQSDVDVCAGENSKSLTEYYIKSLRDFFGSSCRPGRWTIVNTTIDLELRQRYPQLLELCQSSAYQENQQYPFFQSLNCLLNGDGDVALTTLNTIKSYNLTQPEFLNNYTFYCRNGSRINATTGSCSWTKQPWSLVVGNKDVSTDLPLYLRNWFVLQPLDGSSDIQLSEKYVQSFKEVIFPDQLQYNDIQLSEKYVQSFKEVIFPDQLQYNINITFDTPNLETYVSAFRDRPTTENSRLCKSSVVLCVISAEEEKKCKWLQQAALNYGIQPVIDCVTKTNKLECLKAIQNNMADVTVVNSNITYTVNRIKSGPGGLDDFSNSSANHFDIPESAIGAQKSISKKTQLIERVINGVVWWFRYSFHIRAALCSDEFEVGRIDFISKRISINPSYWRLNGRY
ncbi:Transferrin [Popillia japonica]|uniref:Transferrin n=1 Tax=Popillia japonica TaxID=7064 RepID=A0AAW1KIP1_POPJA